MYGVPVARGVRVRLTTSTRHGDGTVIRDGTITRVTHYVHVRLDGDRHARPYHPTDPRLCYTTATFPLNRNA